MILAQNISHSYQDEEVLHNVTLEVQEGEFALLVGKSGSGKSTLLSIVSTLLQPTKGKVFLNGIDVDTIHNKERFRKEHIGFVFQFHYLISYLTVYENITLVMEESNRRYVDDLIRKLGIESLKERYPDEISGGQRQRVAIARALANRPKMIFADEPTGNLDSTNAHTVFSLLASLCKESQVTLVVATHDMDLRRYADKVFEVRDGYIS